jgi:hypothetical protein
LNVPLNAAGAPSAAGAGFCCVTRALASPVEVTRPPLAERPVTNSRAE